MINYIKKILYLGPDGSNSQFACALMIEKLGMKVEIEGVSTITKIIEMLNDEPDTTACVLPVENSIEGVVRETIDNLVKTKNEIFMQAELSMPICHCLISKGKKEDIKTVVSISQAVAQCKNYIANNLGKDVQVLLYTSTSGAAQLAAAHDKSYGAIASKLCAQIYGLNVIDECINDVKDNKTRFVLLSKKDLKIAPKTRTSIAFTTENKPGALLNILEVFKKYDLNCIYLESRPSTRVFGEYIFYADIDKGCDEIQTALDEIGSKCTSYRLLGSYAIV